MRLQIMNSEFNIAVVDSIYDVPEYVEHLHKQFGQAANLEEIAFFYMDERDWIVINKNHPRHELYKDLIIAYFEMKSEENRVQAKLDAPSRVIYNALLILDDIISRRKSLYSRLLASVE